MPLAGRTLLERLVERLKRSKMIDEIVIATTKKSEDDPIVAIGRGCGISVFRGSENDLVDRYYHAAVDHRADVIVRVPGDNPVADPIEVDRVVRYHLASENDFSSSYPDVLDNGFPDGVGAEVFSLAALRLVREMATDPRNREHPHTNFYENTDRFKIGSPECPSDIRRPDVVLDVNTLEEYEVIARLYADLYPSNPRFDTTDVIAWYDETIIPERKRRPE